jgi:hypothetical protein
MSSLWLGYSGSDAVTTFPMPLLPRRYFVRWQIFPYVQSRLNPFFDSQPSCVAGPFCGRLRRRSCTAQKERKVCLIQGILQDHSYDSRLNSEFEKLAIGVLDECAASDPSKIDQLLFSPIRHFQPKSQGSTKNDRVLTCIKVSIKHRL